MSIYPNVDWFIGAWMAVKRQTETAAATMIILICAGWVPHDDDASGAACSLSAWIASAGLVPE